MKRFHVHLSVSDLAQSIRFYSTLFGAAPTKVEVDYAKWMLDDPRINFAISTRETALGVNHLGLQVEAAEELGDLEARLRRAATAVLPEHGVTCCYAVSDKYWVTDPQGVAWEVYHTLQDAPVYGSYQPVQHIREELTAPCCGPKAASDAARGCCT
ncbi:MAG: VOC family protein [Proteobacteria bacterium]|nr:VOC family protein [Pseudomonadota bacterium]